jgi:hypothetical protein
MSKQQILILLVSIAAMAIVVLPFTLLCRYESVPVSIEQEVIINQALLPDRRSPQSPCEQAASFNNFDRVWWLFGIH